MVFNLHDIPMKTPFGNQYVVAPRSYPEVDISTGLRRLLILINGRHTVEHLLSKGLSGVDFGAFEILTQHGLITHVADGAGFTRMPNPFPSPVVAASQPAAPNPTMAARPSVVANPSMAVSAGNPLVAAANARSFSSIRFDVLDVLLEFSLKDFVIKPWIERFEKTHDLYSLNYLAHEFYASNLCMKYPQIKNQLLRILNH